MKRCKYIYVNRISFDLSVALISSSFSFDNQPLSIIFDNQPLSFDFDH